MGLLWLPEPRHQSPTPPAVGPRGLGRRPEHLARATSTSSSSGEGVVEVMECIPLISMGEFLVGNTSEISDFGSDHLC